MASTLTAPLYAAIDMGTNSFKLLIARPHPNGGFLPILRRSDTVILGQGEDTPFSVSKHSESRAIEALRTFQSLLHSQNVAASRTRCVATSAVREASNRAEFLDRVRAQTGLEVEVLPGEEEARLAYLSAVQFFPVFERLVLCVDIGGGSTEFVVGQRGNVLFADSLKLGHVSLTERFRSSNGVEEMRGFVRSVIGESCLVESVKRFGFDVAVGSSGTARALEKAAFYGLGGGGGWGVADEARREWKLRRRELSGVVEGLVVGMEEGLEEFFGRRSEFIVAGAVLLEEIFEALGVEEMEVSGFALAEGVLGEIFSRVGDGRSLLGGNARWVSVLRLATRFCGKKRMADAALCVGVAMEIFEASRKCDESSVLLDDKDAEYLEAACMLHNIGISSGKKGYHKQSYHLIMNGNHLHGYSPEEIKVIALLARYHRKKLPKLDHSLFKEFPIEVKKFEFLCAILRVSVALWKHQSKNIDQEKELCSHSHEGFNFKAVLMDFGDRKLEPSNTLPLPESHNDGQELRQELNYFKTVFHRDLSDIISSRTLD